MKELPPIMRAHTSSLALPRRSIPSPSPLHVIPMKISLLRLQPAHPEAVSFLPFPHFPPSTLVCEASVKAMSFRVRACRSRNLGGAGLSVSRPVALFQPNLLTSSEALEGRANTAFRPPPSHSYKLAPSLLYLRLPRGSAEWTWVVAAGPPVADEGHPQKLVFKTFRGGIGWEPPTYDSQASVVPKPNGMTASPTKNTVHPLKEPPGRNPERPNPPAGFTSHTHSATNIPLPLSRGRAREGVPPTCDSYPSGIPTPTTMTDSRQTNPVPTYYGG